MGPNQVNAGRSSPGANSQTRDVLAWGLVIVTVMVLVVEPLQSGDLWWDLSRGRQILNGSISPSRELLAVSDRREADWLSGLPAILAYSAAGVWGLFFLKGVSASAFFASLIGRPRCDLRLLLIVTALLAARGVWDGTARIVDVVMFLAARRFAVSWFARPSIQRAAVWTAAQLLWANVGPFSFFGLLTTLGLTADSVLQRRSWRVWFPLLVPSSVAACLTPRGIGTIRDSLCLAFPAVVADSATLFAVDWQPAWVADWDWRFWAWCVLSVTGWIIHLGAPKSVNQTLVFAGVQVTGWNCHLHTSFAMLATAILIQESYWADASLVWTSKIPLPWQRSMAFAGILLVLVANLWLDWPSLPQRAGLLLRPHLDPSLLAESIVPLTMNESAHCTDTLAAGMLCWIKPTGPRPWDVASRALLSGRLRELALLNHDLREGHRDPFQRSDGSWGGWWSVLHRHNTGLLLINSNEVRMLRSLEPTVWKPLSLDSPVLPYGRAGDEPVSLRIVEVLRQRQLVNTGTWTYRANDTENDVRLARVLRAMQLPIAALRVIHAARRVHDDNFLRQELAACQLVLGYRERVIMGQASDWRMLAFRMLTPAREVDIRSVESLGRDDFQSFVPPDWMQRSLTKYLAGELAQARTEARGDSPDMIFVDLLLALEAGQSEDANRLRDLLQRRHRDHPLTLVSSDVMAQ